MSYDDISSFVRTPSIITHMESDRFNRTSILLYSTKNFLYSSDGCVTDTIVLDAVNSITGFTQSASLRYVFVVVQELHCVKLLSRHEKHYQSFVGKCGSAGFQDGEHALFNRPYAAVLDAKDRDKLIISDTHNHALRYVDTTTKMTSTIIRSDIRHPQSLCWHDMQLLVVNKGRYISLVSWAYNGSVSNNILAGSKTAGDTFGRFSDARFRAISDIAKLGDDAYIVVDYQDDVGKMKLIDMSKQVVGHVCIYEGYSCKRTTTTGGFPYGPRSLLNLEGKLYVGAYSRIFAFSRK